ncbi:MAG: pyridoxal 5'-phosphate synthase glutaminase subunit PdxT [Candidatus Peregrinibacteria bacterium]
MIVGVLAVQGDFAEHITLLRSMGVAMREVRSMKDLNGVDHLIIPGGESTVMAKFLRDTGLWVEIRRRAGEKGKEEKEGKEGRDRLRGIYGTCAGAILLAKEVTGGGKITPLGLIDISIERNAYGTQRDSFEAKIHIRGVRLPVPVAFIRAPQITRVGKGVEVLAAWKGDPVLVRQGCILAGTFHPEVRGERAIHRMFLRLE